MIGFKFNRSVPTTLKLNGPSLGYLEQVTDTKQHITGVVTFSGITTATYPNDNVGGTFDFKWYLDDSELNSSMTSPSVSIVSVGNSSILTLDNIPLSNDNSRVYLKTDYIPATGESQANNEPLQSDTGTIELIKNIQILTQPVTQTVASGDDVTYTVEAQLENGLTTGGPISITDNSGSVSVSDPTGSNILISVNRFINVPSGTESHPIGSIGYDITFTQLGSTGDVDLEAYVNNTSTRASGLIAGDNSIAVSPGYPQRLSANSFRVAFDMTNSLGPGRQATLVRSWGFNFLSPIVYGIGGRTVQINVRASINEFTKKCRDNGMNLYYSTMSGERWAIDHNRSLPEAGNNTVQNLYCEVSHPQSFNSPQNTNTVTMTVVSPRPLITFEAYTFANDYATKDVDFDSNPEFTLDQNTFGSQYNIIQFHSVERNNPIIMNMFGSKGSGSNGGEGGTATIKFTAEKDIEYTVIGISNNSAVFLYRGSTLIAVVGEGGNATSSVSGGAGGGANGSGGDGGNNGNSGGQYSSLSLNGVYGSITPSSVSLQSGDTLAIQNQGGKTITCTKGSYWINQAISACSNNSSSEIKYVNIDGTTINSSSSIIRGFKPGYTVTSTAGAGIAGGGQGGNGASGGDGGQSSSQGGGGGSGYNDGSVEVISTRLGGSTGLAKITMRTETSQFVHFFDNRVRPKRTTSLTSTGNIVSVSAQSESGNGQPGDTGAKHYLVTMDADYTGLTIDVTSDLTAAGGSTDPDMRAGAIQKQNSTQWRVWFVRGGGTSNTFIREATIIGNL